MPSRRGVWAVLALALYSLGLHCSLCKPDDPGFDLLILVRTWPPTFCQSVMRHEHKHCSVAPIDFFTIHGLWPEYSNGRWPQYCSKLSAFDPSNSTQRQRCEWPSFHGTDRTFWEHEWDKHGTCAATLPALGGQDLYFENAMALHEQLDVNSALESAGIWPSDQHESFSTDDASAVLRDAFGVEPQLACDARSSALAEVWICIDINLQPIHCPPSVHPESPCKTTFQMPQGCANCSRVPRECERFFPPYNNRFRPSYIQYLLLLVAISSSTIAAYILQQWSRDRPLICNL